MSKEIIISPSILGADFHNLNNELRRVESAHLKYLHFDVMDGVFVNNTAFDIETLKNISSKFDFINDVHLMICNPQNHYLDYIKAGANILTFHVEAFDSEDEIKELITNIKNAGCKAGLSLKPATPIEKLLPYLSEIDQILVMSVEPGKGGQSFIESSLSKISELNRIRNQFNYHLLISVDGGINDKTSKKVIEAGADILVSGSYLFKSQNLNETILNLKS